MARKKSKMVSTAQKLLEAKGLSYKQWLHEQLREKKMAIFEGNDKNWEEETTERLCEAYVLSQLEEITKSTTKKDKNIGGNLNENDSTIHTSTTTN